MTEKLGKKIRYRTNERKKDFKNYESINNSNGALILKQQKHDQINNIKITIPSIKDSEAFKKMWAAYYLNIYKYNQETTISIVDSFKLYKSYEFKFEENFYVKNIELPKEENYDISLKPLFLIKNS